MSDGEGGLLGYIKTACGKKRKFIAPWLAEEAAEAMTRRYKERFRAYKCGFCHHYHVGHVVPAKFRVAKPDVS